MALKPFWITAILAFILAGILIVAGVLRRTEVEEDAEESTQVTSTILPDQDTSPPVYSGRGTLPRIPRREPSAAEQISGLVTPDEDGTAPASVEEPPLFSPEPLPKQPSVSVGGDVVVPPPSPTPSIIGGFYSPELKAIRDTLVQEGSIGEDDFLKLQTHGDTQKFFLKFLEYKLSQGNLTQEQFDTKKQYLITTYEEIEKGTYVPGP